MATRIDIATLVIDLIANDAGLRKSLTQSLRTVEMSMTRAAARMTQLGGRMSAGLTAPLVAAGGFALKMSADFDRAMREVNSLVNLGEADFKRFKDEVRGLSTSLGVDLIDSTQAVYDAISAGIPRQNVLTFLETATRAGIAGVSTTEAAVRVLTKTMAAYGSETVNAERLSDLLFATVKAGQTKFTELADSLPNVASIAASLGTTQAELLGVLARTTQVSAGTSDAVTRIASAMAALLKPNAEMNKLLERAGIASVEAEVRARGFTNTLLKLSQAAGGNATAIAQAFGRKEAILLIQDLARNTDDWRASLELVAQSVGATAQAFADIDQGPGRATDRLRAKLQSLRVQIGDILTPAFLDYAEALDDVLGRLLKTNPEIVKLAVGVAAVAAALGPLILASGLALKGLIAIGAIKLGGLLVALAGAAVILSKMTEETEEFENAWTRVNSDWLRWGAVITGFVAAINDVVFFLRLGWEAVAAVIGTIPAIVSELGRHVNNFVVDAIDLFDDFADKIQAAFHTVFENIRSGLNTLVNFIRTTLFPVINEMIMAVNKAAAAADPNFTELEIDTLPTNRRRFRPRERDRFSLREFFGLERRDEPDKSVFDAVNKAFDRVMNFLSFEERPSDQIQRAFGKFADDFVDAQGGPGVLPPKDLIDDEAIKKEVEGIMGAIDGLGQSTGFRDAGKEAVTFAKTIEEVSTEAERARVGVGRAMEEIAVGVRDAVDELPTLREDARNFANDFASRTASFLTDAGSSWKSFGDVVKSVIRDIATEIVRRNILGLVDDITAGISGIGSSSRSGGGSFFGGLISGVGSLVGGLFGGGRAQGGPVYPGTVYPVGERGMELFEPLTPGRIIPFPQAAPAAATAAEPNIVVNQVFQPGVSHAELATILPDLEKKTTAAVLEGVLRGGAFKRAIRGV